MSTVTSVLRTRIIGPVEGSWDDLGERLRALRNVSHRALNAGIVAGRLLEETPRESRPPRATVIGRAVKAGLAKAEAPAVIVDASASAAAKLYQTRRRDALRGDCSLPSYRYPAPIFVRDRGWSVALEDGPQGRRVVLSVKLHAGRETPYVRAVLAPPKKSKKRRRIASTGWWWAAIGEMAANPEARTDLKLIYDERRRDWHALLGRISEVQERDPERVLGIHFGMVVPVQVAEADPNGRAAAIGDPRELWAYKRREADLRRRLSAASRGQKGAPGGGGRGWKRRNRAVTRLDDREDRWLTSKSRQYAAEAVKLALRWRCGTLALGSYVIDEGPVARARETDRDERGVEHVVLFWQPARLKAAVLWAAKKAGLSTVDAAEAYQSQTCRACGRQDPESRVSRALFRCVGCGHEDDAEINAARNLAQAGEIARAAQQNTPAP